MTWKKSIDDVKIICKKCGKEMVLESSLNSNNGIYSCSRCKEYINLKINR